MPALYAHTTRATGTVLTATIYNGDHQNHIDNGVPAQLDDYSTDVAQMRLVTDPGGVGSESLATSLAGDLERLRFVIRRLQNGAQWYSGGTGVIGRFRNINLDGINNSTTPLTKYNFTANAVVAVDSSGNTIVKSSGIASTEVDINLAGPVAGGRDQAGAFSANSWVYIYWILKTDLTISLTVSATGPATGPTLPTGYTHWCYCASLRLNASTQFHRTYVSGSHVYYDVANGGSNRVLAAGTATILTNIDCAAIVPPDAKRTLFNFIMEAAFAASGPVAASVRPGGSAAVSPGQIAIDFVVSTDLLGRDSNMMELPVINNNRTIDYLINVAPTGGGFFIDVFAYIVDNGSL